jgi:spermidine synthase
VAQFSITIGVFLTAMGIGSWLSRLVQDRLLEVFLTIELALGVLGGFAAALLNAAYAAVPQSYTLIMIALLLLLGSLIGLEVPLLTRIAADYGSLRDTVANVLTFDYIGALAAALLFPLLLLPVLGIMKTSFVVGAFNILIVALNLYIFWYRLKGRGGFVLGIGAALLLLGLGFAQSAQAVALFEHRLYQDKILHAEQSRFQRVVVTQYRDDLRLFLDRELQFSSRDEYRYHEALVHPAMALAANREHVLIIGGDGLGAREVLKYADMQQVTLVDLDPAVTRLGQEFGPLVRLNAGALNDPRVRVVNADGYRFLTDSSDLYQVILIDLPDPRTESLARLYSREFYGLIGRHLAPGGMMVTQAASPYFAHKAYWCIVHTIQAAGFTVQPYHTYVPSFGEWGFVLASNVRYDWDGMALDVPLRYLEPALLPRMRQFDADMAQTPTSISTQDTAAVWRYYLEDWRRWRE